MANDFSKTLADMTGGQASMVDPNSDEYYFNQVDPVTGIKFDIPLLDRQDPDYRAKYIEYMKMREKQPEKFKKVISWG